MATKNDLKEELLKQMDKSHDKTSETNAKSIQKIIERDTARVKRLKRVVIVSWILVIMCFLVGGIAELNIRDPESGLFYLDVMWANILVLTFRALLLVALVMTISFHVRSRSLSLRHIQVRLANMEEQLKRMSQDK